MWISCIALYEELTTWSFCHRTTDSFISLFAFLLLAYCSWWFLWEFLIFECNNTTLIIQRIFHSHKQLKLKRPVRISVDLPLVYSCQFTSSMSSYCLQLSPLHTFYFCSKLPCRQDRLYCPPLLFYSFYPGFESDWAVELTHTVDHILYNCLWTHS